MKKSLLATLTLSIFIAVVVAQTTYEVSERAKKIHFSSLVLDTHIDVTPNLQREGWRFDERHTTGHVDLPRMSFCWPRLCPLRSC